MAVAAVAENAGNVDPGAYARATVAAAKRTGAAVRTETPVAVELGPEIVNAGTDDSVEESFDAVLVAAGAHTPSVVSDVALIPV